MIAEKCFTREWLEQCRETVGRVDPGLLEKTIYAFELLGRLQEKGLPFVFKGGTALLLLLDEFRRLSIDVDISCSLPKDEVARIVAEVASEGPFLDAEPDERDPNRLPKRHHYAFHFESIVDTRFPGTLQLDVLQDEAHYPKMQSVPLASRFVIPENDILIKTPTVEGLLADKLTAFAPTTVGVPYDGFKASIRIVKQISDVGELFLHARDGDNLADAYERIFSAENRYRDNAFTMEQALEDTVESALLLGSINLRGFTPSIQSETLLKGVGQVDSHMIGRRYRLDDAKTAAARAAHLAALIRTGSVPSDMSPSRFDPAQLGDMTALPLQGRLAVLNRLKATNPEAFFHWLQVQAVTAGESS